MIKELSDQIPLYRKGGWGIGNINNDAHHHYIKGKKSPPEGGKALQIFLGNRLFAHISLDIVVM